MIKRRTALIAGSVAGLAVAGLPIMAQPNSVELTLVSYAVTQAAYENIIEAFAEQWLEETGQTVTVQQSYGGSGSQARAVIDGLEADIVALALALDTYAIQEAGLIEPGWEDEAPNGAIVTESVAVLVTREGNPKNINDWSDLAQDGVTTITANPKTSGGARWNFLGLWGSLTQAGGSEEAALEFVTEVYSRVPVLPRNAREATDTFFQRGQGDVLINYENEVLLAALQGEVLPYVVPSDNIAITNPVAIVDQYVDEHGTREVAEAFLAYLWTPEAQREFAEVGFRPVLPEVVAEYADQYPVIENLFTSDDFGGWDAIQEKFFADGAVFDDIQANIAGR